MEYTNFQYLYPPRPETKIKPTSLVSIDNAGKFFAQPKLNGDCMVVFMNETDLILRNRHKASFKQNIKMTEGEFRQLYRGEGWMVLCGEYMNKSKKDEHNKTWNQKFVIFDILVYNGEYLLGKTFQERFNLIEQLFPENIVLGKPLLSEITENCFRVCNITTDFKKVYDNITRYDMYEGLVLKMKDGKLEPGYRQANNVRTQAKCRKATKNYGY